MFLSDDQPDALAADIPASTSKGSFVRRADIRAFRSERPLPAHIAQCCATKIGLEKGPLRNSLRDAPTSALTAIVKIARVIMNCCRRALAIKSYVDRVLMDNVAR